MNENVKKSVGWGLGLVPSEAEHEMIIDLAPACPCSVSIYLVAAMNVNILYPLIHMYMKTAHAGVHNVCRKT